MTPQAAATRELTAGSPRSPFRLGGLEWLVLGIVAVLGLMHLPQPFEHDQSVFVLGAKKLASGAVLYRDFWDVKQPGIFWFFGLAGRLFGLREEGVHLLELCYQIVFCLTLMFTLARYGCGRIAAAAAPLLTVGIYYAVTGSWHLTQIEALSGLPLYLSLWFAARACDPASRRWRDGFLSGLFGVLALVLKLPFLPIVAGFWLVAIVWALSRRERPGTIAAGLLVPLVFGALLPALAVLGWFAYQGSLQQALWTFFIYPLQAAGEVHGTRINVLFQGTTWFASNFAPLLGLGAVGMALRRQRRDPMEVMLVVWFLAGAVVILIQRFSWWQYHYFLLVTPLGVLAARGVAALWERLTLDAGAARRRLLLAAILLLFAGPLMQIGVKCAWLIREGFALGAAHRHAYQARVSQLYSHVWKQVEFLSQPGALPGSIFAINSPIYYYLSGREASPALPGAIPVRYMTPPEWAALTRRLAQSPPAYIEIDGEHLEQAISPASAAGGFTALLDARYRIVRDDAYARWYERVR